MERNSLSSSTRSRGSFLFSPVSTTSALGKRGAAEAGLDVNTDPAAVLRAYRELESSYNLLKRHHLTVQGQEQKHKDEIEELRAEMERLKQERRVLAEGKASDRTANEAFDKEWSEERISLASQISDLRKRNSALTNTFHQLESEHSQLSSEHSKLQLESSHEITSLTNRLQEVQNDRDGLKGWKRRAEGLSIELEEMKRRVQMGSMERHDGDEEGDRVVKAEIGRQAKFLASTKKELDAAQVELANLRKEKKEYDGVKAGYLKEIRGLKSDNRILHEQLERSRRDMDSLTQNFSSSDNSSEDLPSLQTRFATLTSLHAQQGAELAANNQELATLHDRLRSLSQESQSAISVLTRAKAEAEREGRWAKEGRDSAEKREEAMRRELDVWRQGDVQATSGPNGGSAADAGARVSQLEAIVENYRREIDGMQRDSRDLEARLTEGAGLVKQSDLESAEARIAQLQAEITGLEENIAQLTSANATLDAEVNDLMRRVASGEYNPSLERCIELKGNPAAKIQAIRQGELNALRDENEALLTRLGVVDKNPVPDGGAEGGGLVPRETWERTVKESEALRAGHEKRLQRLKEIYSSKTREFLEAVYSLLGWRIRFDETSSSGDIRLTSMYAPKGKMGLTLKFASQEGHFGTMQMSGAMSRGLEESRRFWIEERQSVPGFLAQVTTEMFEKTTIGRAAGYVGLD